MSKKKKILKRKKTGQDNDNKDYGVVLLKNKKFKHKIFPQRGKVPDDDDDSYKIV